MPNTTAQEPIKIDADYDVFLAAEKIGAVLDIREHWPAFQGRFEPTEKFSAYQSLFEQAVDTKRRFSSAERAAALDRIFELELTLSSRHRDQRLTRDRNRIRRGELGYFYVADAKAWFRLFHCDSAA